MAILPGCGLAQQPPPCFTFRGQSLSRRKDEGCPSSTSGSKRRLVPVLGDIADLKSDACTALDLFTGTTRVAQEFKRRGATVTAVDTARYSEVFSQCHIATDASVVDKDDLREAIEFLNALPGYAATSPRRSA